MKESLNYVSQILLIILLILQIGVMLYLFYINHKRFKEDKKFWKSIDEKIQKTRDKFQLYLDEHSEEENDKSEQDN